MNRAPLKSGDVCLFVAGVHYRPFGIWCSQCIGQVTVILASKCESESGFHGGPLWNFQTLCQCPCGSYIDSAIEATLMRIDGQAEDPCAIVAIDVPVCSGEIG
jgi:hypothetical protein